MKKLVKCPNCEVNGKAEVLGEIDENGNFIVLRFHKGSTIISGDRFEVTCGNCGEKVYRKEVNYENTNNGSIGIFGYAFSSQMQTVGSPS
jgi:hypothetical protein